MNKIQPMFSKTNFLFYVFIFLLSSSLEAQKTWSFQTPEHSFLVTTENLKDENGKENGLMSVKKIDVFLISTKTKIQTVKPEQQFLDDYFDSSFVFRHEDMNFDGSADFRLLNGTTTNLQTGFWYWFYNKNSGKFEQDTTLNDFMNPSFDPVKKTIHKWWRYGFSNFGHALYQWKNEKPVLIFEQEELSEAWDTDNPSATIVTKRLVNGKFLTSKKTAKPGALDFMHNKCKGN